MVYDACKNGLFQKDKTFKIGPSLTFPRRSDNMKTVAVGTLKPPYPYPTYVNLWHHGCPEY